MPMPALEFLVMRYNGISRKFLRSLAALSARSLKLCTLQCGAFRIYIAFLMLQGGGGGLLWATVVCHRETERGKYGQPIKSKTLHVSISPPPGDPKNVVQFFETLAKKHYLFLL